MMWNNRKREEKDIKKIINQYDEINNEFDLSIEHLDYLITKYPNDMELGSKIRNYINKINEKH